MLLRLKGEFMAEDGSGVNYALMSKSEAFQAYKTLALDLQNINLDDLKAYEGERKAFFINLYNILMIHGLIAQGSLPEAPTKVEVRNKSTTFKVPILLIAKNLEVMFLFSRKKGTKIAIFLTAIVVLQITNFHVPFLIFLNFFE